MNRAIERTTRVIDATGKTVGRLATETANILQGKNKPDYAPNRDSGDGVVILNISQAVFSGKKMGQKTYFHYSGYPGGIKRNSLWSLWSKNPASLFCKVVAQMLPANTLRKKWLRRLKFNDRRTSEGASDNQ